MRKFVIKQATNLKALSAQLLGAKPAAGQAALALEALAALNAVDLEKKLSAGTVLLVPDAPSFNTSASESVAGDALDDFRQLIRSGLDAAATKLKEGNEARTAERAAVAAVLKTSVVKRIVETDTRLKQQIESVTKALEDDRQQAKEAERAVEAATKGAPVEMAAFVKSLV